MSARDDTLLQTARRTLALGVAGRRHQPDLSGHAAALTEPAATFVTLRAGTRLRGCRGTLEPIRPLLQDVAHNTWLTAFDDPRFPPVRAPELDELTLELSLLSALEQVPARTRSELQAALAPGHSGLLIVAGARRATFLPKVWEALPDPDSFLDALLRKAGIGTRGWDGDRQAWTYRTTSISGPAVSG